MLQGNNLRTRFKPEPGEGGLHLGERQLGDGGQAQVGVKERDAIRHVHSAICRAGGEQQPVDAAAGKEAAVQVHLDVSPAGQLHFAHAGGGGGGDGALTEQRERVSDGWERLARL